MNFLSSLFTLCYFFLYLKSVPIHVIVHVLHLLLCMCLLPDLDEVDFSLEIPVSSNRLTSHLKPRQWPPITTPREKKPDREIRVRLSVTETDFVVVEDLTSTASNAVVLKVRTSITVCMSSIHDCSTTQISFPPSFLPLSLPFPSRVQ